MDFPESLCYSKAMKNIFLFTTVLFLSLTASAEVRYLKLSKGKAIAYEYLTARNGAPTLVLLPGVNRALTSEDPSVEILVHAGWNVVLPSLSAHPLSLQGLSKNEDPYFTQNSAVQSEDLAKDIEQLLTYLKVERAIPVTLSYSSTLGAVMDPKRFPHIIETVPMGTAMEADPQAATVAALWENWFRLNPFMAPFWIRQFRDNSYWLYWSAAVDTNLSEEPEFYGPSPRVREIKQGYVAITRAAENFDFTRLDFSKDPRTRDFIFAENEDAGRLANQMIVLKNYLATGKAARVVVVKDAGHILPTDQPEIYAQVVSLLASTPQQEGVQFVVVKENDNLRKVRWQGREALEAWMKQALH